MVVEFKHQPQRSKLELVSNIVTPVSEQANQEDEEKYLENELDPNNLKQLEAYMLNMLKDVRGAKLMTKIYLSYLEPVEDRVKFVQCIVSKIRLYSNEQDSFKLLKLMLRRNFSFSRMEYGIKQNEEEFLQKFIDRETQRFIKKYNVLEFTQDNDPKRFEYNRKIIYPLLFAWLYLIAKGVPERLKPKNMKTIAARAIDYYNNLIKSESSLSLDKTNEEGLNDLESRYPENLSTKPKEPIISKMPKEFYTYIKDKNDQNDLVVEYYELLLMGKTTKEIQYILWSNTPQKIKDDYLARYKPEAKAIQKYQDHLQQKFVYHLEAFISRTGWYTFHSENDILPEQRLGLTTEEFENFWDNLIELEKTLFESVVKEGLKDLESIKALTVTDSNGKRIKSQSLEKAWGEILLKAYKIRKKRTTK